MSVATEEAIAGRPIAVIGSGTLGRRIALMASTRGAEVCLFDHHQGSLEAGLTYVTETLPAVVASIPGATAGRVRGETDLAW
jgi:3-hydroxybutyryl-CoA dehydrogenase